MFNFLKKNKREFNLPEQVLPYKLEELRDLFMRVSQDGRYSTVGATTMRDMISHINKMYTNVSPIIIPDMPEALAIKLNDLTGVALNRYRNVTTIDEAISVLINSNDLANDITYPVFEVIIDNLILNSHSYSSERIDLKALKMDVTRLWKAWRVKYTVDKVEHWDNRTGYTINDLIKMLRKIKKEKNTMHMTFDDLISSLTNSENTVFITHAQSYIYHLKETYKNKSKVSRYLDYVDHKLTKLSMRDEKELPLETFIQFMVTGRNIAKNNGKSDFDKLISQLERGDFAYMTTLESLPSRNSLVSMDDAINIISILHSSYTEIQLTSYLSSVMKQLQLLVSNGDYYVSRDYMLESIRTAKYIYQDSQPHTIVTGTFSVHDHIPTVSEKLKETRDEDIKWTISAKEELVKWYNTLPNNSVYSEATLLEKDYPKAYHLLAVYPEYLTNKGYTLETTAKHHYTNEGVELTPVNTITVSWGTDKMKKLLAFVLDGTYDYETKQSI